jgi:hypothetical protein
MYYGARFYDPVLSYFVSANMIPSTPKNPKTQHCFTYVLNSRSLYAKNRATGRTSRVGLQPVGTELIA